MNIFVLLLLIAAGFTGGFFGSAVGSAGLVTLPVLLLLGLSPHAAIGTARPAVIVLEGFAALRYHRDKVLTGVLLKRGLWLGLAGAVGSTLGAMLVVYIGDQALRLLLALIILTMTVVLFTRKQWGLQERPERQRKIISLSASTFLAGLYAGFFGFTFGTIIIIVFVAFGHTLLQSSAMGKVVGAVTSGASASVFLWHGYIRWDYAIALSAGFALGGWIGARVAAKAGNKYVKGLLIIVVIASVTKLLVDYVSVLNSSSLPS